MSGCAELAAFLERHRRLFVLTGAGCSTPSGIPDYRDEDGAWRHRRPMTFTEFSSSPAARRRYWAGSLQGWPRVRDARPNAAHDAIARLQSAGRVTRVVTQNVDRLHSKAGSRGVVDLHGRLDLVECLECGAHVARDDVQALLVAWNAERLDTPAAPRPDGDARVAGDTETFRVPDCRECGGVLKPRVVFFGENVPRSRVAEAWAGIEAADAVLVVGSSLMVYSGYRFALEAARQGKPVAAVNRGRTRADEMLALKASGDCAELLADAVAAATSRSRGASVESPWEGGRP